MRLHGVAHGQTTPGGLYKFFARTSLSTWLSSDKSATSRLSLLVFFLKTSHTSGLRNVQTAVLAAPLVEGCIGYRVLAAKLGHRYTCFGLFENPDDLLFTETALLHDHDLLGRVTNF